MKSNNNVDDDENVFENTPLLYNNDDYDESSSVEIDSTSVRMIEQSHKNFANGFGGKTIDTQGTMALLINNVTGPGMVQLSLVYQQAGIIVPTLTLGFFVVLSCLSSTMLAEAMTKLPGNDVFQSRAEIITLAKFYFGDGIWYMLTVFMFVVSLISINVASIIISAQTLDLALVKIKGTCAMEFYPHFGFKCVESAPIGAATPFPHEYVFSLGFFIILVGSVPLGYFNLDDNIVVQKVACAALWVIVAFWTAFFVYHGLEASSTPAFGDDYSSVVGVLYFNYTFVTSVPSWINEKKPKVSVQRTLWNSTLIGTFMFLIIGILGAMSLSIGPTQDILRSIDEIKIEGDIFLTIAKITVYLFPLVALVSSIPIFSIIIRYNLLQNRICNKAIANIVAVLMPWAIALPFYTGKGLIEVTNWSSLLFNGFINFTVPMIFYVMAFDKSQRAFRVRRFIKFLEKCVELEKLESKAALIKPKKSLWKRFIRSICNKKSTDDDDQANSEECSSDSEIETTPSEVHLAIIKATMAERIRLEEQSKSNASLSSVDQNNSVNANDDVVVAKRRASLIYSECEANDEVVYSVDQSFVAWPFVRGNKSHWPWRDGTIPAKIMIAITVVLNFAAIGIAIQQLVQTKSN